MRTEQIRIRILTAVGVAFAGMLLCSVLCTQALLRKNIHRDASATMDEFHKLFQTELDEEAELCRVLLDSIETKPTFQNAWLAQDEEALFQLAAPLLEEFRSLHRITHLYFIDTNKVCFLRVHKKEKKGDTIDRFTLDEAVRTGEAASGVETGPLGAYSLRVVHPWRVDGQLVGYIELGGEIDHIALEIKEILGVDFGFFIKKAHILRTGCPRGIERMRREFDWDQFENHVVVGRTITNFPPSVHEAIRTHERAEHSNFKFGAVVGGRNYLCGFKCMKDAAGQTVGDVVVMSDVTCARAAARHSVCVVSGVVVCVGGALFGFLFLFVGQIQKKLVKNEACLRAEMEQRRKTEDALNLETGRAEEYLNLVEVIMVALDAQGVVTMINRKGCEVLGYNESEILGRNWVEHFVPERVAKELKSVSDDLLNKGSDGGGVFENPILTKEGKERIIAWHNAPIRNGKNEMVGYLSAGSDITERKAAEAALQERESQLRQIIDLVPHLIFVKDETGRFELVNQATADVFGTTVEDLTGRRDSDFVATEEEAEHFRADDLEVIRSGETKVIPNEPITDSENRLRYLQTTKVPFRSSSSGNTALLGIAIDITEKKVVEEQLRQAQKMESIGQLVGGVAHDFNNILQIINGYADIARAKLPPSHCAFASIEEIAKAGGRAKELVKQLLTYSRQQVIDPVDLDLNKEIGESKNMLGRLIGENVELKWIFGENLGTIFADKGQMQQVLMNLCVNARDAMLDGGTLSVQTKNIAIGSDDLKTHSWAREGDYVRLSVKDTGCGMESETCAKIFDPFFTTKEVGKGTGLGLSTVYGIVKQNEGHIDVSSEVGEGTVFNIYFPVSHSLPKKMVRSVSQNHPAIEVGVETVLVVEDDATLLGLAICTLTDAGYTVLSAKDGEEAVQVFEEHADEIDCVMMDVVMPRMGGEEAMGEILKKRPALRHLFVSGYSPDAGHTDFIKKQGAHLLSKPYDADALLGKIRDVLDED